MKTLQQHRARPQRWLATLTIALLALGAPLATAAPAFASEALPVVEPLEQQSEQTPVDEAAPADAAPVDAVDEPVADDVAEEAAADAPEQPAVVAPEAAPPAEEAPDAAPLVADVAALAVTVDSASEEAGLTVRVVGSGFGATTGAYGALIEKGTEAAVGASGGYTAFGYWMTPGAIVDGAFDKSLVAATTALDRTKLYEVIVWQGHSAPNADTIYARADVAPTTEQWNALFPPAVAPTPSVTVSKTEGLNAAGETVTVTGTGFVPGDATSGARPPLAGKFAGSYVVFGRFADVWKPSESAPSASRAGSGDTKWAVPAADMAAIGGPNAGAIELKADGSFEATLTVSEEFAKNPGSGNYGIYTYSGSGAKAAQFETFTPITFAPKVVTPTIAASVDSATAESGLTVRVVGSSFGTTTGAYAALIEKGTEANVDASGGYAAFGFWMTPGAIVGGAFDKTLVAPTTALDRTKLYEVIVWQGHTAPTADTIYARAAVTPTDAQWSALFPTTPEPGAAATTTTLSVDKTAVVTGSTVTATAVIAPVAASGTVSFFNGVSVVAKDVAVTNGTATATVKLSAVGSASLTAVFTPAKPALFNGSASAAVVVAVAAKPVTPPVAQKGELAWGVYGAFRDYVTGPIASGSITPVDGASAAGSAFLFAQAGGTVDLQAGKGTAEYSGGVRFTGHHGALDLTLSAPKLRLDSASRATLSVAVNGARVDFATVNLAAAGTSTDKGKTLVVDAPVTLSAAGAIAFQDFYPAGTILDPLTVAFSNGTTEPGETVGTRTGLVVDKSAVTVGDSVALTATVTPTTAQGNVIFAVNDEQIGAPVRLADGAASATAVLRTVGNLALTARFVPDAGFAASSSAARTVAVTSGVVPPITPPVTPPTTPVVPPVVAPTVQGGSLSWGVSASFRDYITKPVSGGSITVGGGATSSGGAFQFGQSGGNFNQDSGTGTADYAGNVRFTGHGGILDLTFSNPSLSVTGPSSAILSLSVNGGRVDFATVDLGAAARSTLNGATVFSGAPVTLTAAGSSAFQGYYPAGRGLDPLTVTIGAAAAAPAGSTGTVSTASVRTPAASDVPATPPATTGITLSAAVLAGLQAGGQISFEVDGFQPNETGIRVVIYSTPTVLAENLTADANGVVRWSGTLPATLTGQHTLTVQGSISKGIVLTIPERTVAGSCAVSGATLDWGFKASFLAYISSGIASGGWELSGGTTEADGLFHWADGSGSIDAETGSGLVNYTGGIRFTGHDGALDTTIANPRIELVSATEGYLVLDVTGTTQQGEPIAAQAVRFGSLALGDGSLQVTETGITGTDIAAELTDAGAAAFGTYPAGDALDPVSFTLPTADCAVVAEEAVAADTGAGDTEATATGVDTAEQGVDWVVWILAAALAAAAAVIVVLLVKRRRAGAGASAE